MNTKIGSTHAFILIYKINVQKKIFWRSDVITFSELECYSVIIKLCYTYVKSALKKKNNIIFLRRL